MPLINVKRIWTPLELFGIQLLHSLEEKRWYIKRSRKPLKRIL
ncbi:hypothetical protein SK3146_03572 [Paenibacillus konkukensis]|uniref:Uncharacterized protein n=1 Tax=Paenibacillus konkukensis TaxID=2020716 RepID=A0ABY4RRB4_9BACL|nr:hypothetical protein SK3146_03572 [Paenibacillus konkukensis]